MPEILISGCSDSEYSYDAEFDGRPNGAMTALALRVIKQNPDVTYREFYAGLRALLPSEDYPQTPQLEGSDINKDRKLFEPLTVEPAEPAPTYAVSYSRTNTRAGVTRMPYGSDAASETFLQRVMINRSADEASALLFSPQFMLIQAFFIYNFIFPGTFVIDIHFCRVFIGTSPMSISY